MIGSRLAPAFRRRFLAFAVLAALVEVAAWCQLVLAVQVRRFADASDFRAYYVAARVARDYGWSHVYDLGAQLHELRLWWPHALPLDFISPPPVAWLVYPLSFLPPHLAYLVFAGVIWLAVLAASQLAAPPSPWGRLAFACLALGLLPATSAVVYGQVSGIVLLALTAAWRLLDRHPWWAGLALAGIAFKPHLAALVPVALLVSGRLRAFAGFSAGALALLGAGLAAVGVPGMTAMLQLDARYTADATTRLWSLPSLLGGGPAAQLAPALVAALTLAGSALGRRRPSLVVAAAAAASLLANEYLHGMDLVVYLLPIWIGLRSGWRPLQVVAAVHWLVLDVAVAVPWMATLSGSALLAACLLAACLGPQRVRTSEGYAAASTSR